MALWPMALWHLLKCPYQVRVCLIVAVRAGAFQGGVQGVGIVMLRPCLGLVVVQGGDRRGRGAG